MNTRTADIFRAPLNQRGFTLLEMMVAVAISAALIVGVAQVFITSKNTYRVTENLSRIQENGRFAMDEIARDVRMAGYKGCYSGVDSNTKNVLNDAEGSILYDFDVGLEGFDEVNTSFSASPGLITTLNNAATAAAPANDPDHNLEDFELVGTGGNHSGPDVVVIRAVFGDLVRVSERGSSNENNTNDNTTGAANLFVANRGEGTCADGSPMYSGLCAADILMVSDCQKTSVFQITSIQDRGSQDGGSILVVHSRNNTLTPGNSDAAWGGAKGEQFDPGSEVMKAGSRIYFIANSLGVDGQRNPPVPSLFMMTEDGIAELLAENVEDMQIVYGVDADTDAGFAGSMLRANAAGLNKDATAVKTNNWWNKVVSAEIRLLMRSDDQGLTPDGAPLDYIYNQTTYTPNDTRLRREFVIAVTLRNRALL